MKRVLTAAVLIPLVVYVIFWAPWWGLRGFIMLIAILCSIEFSQILGFDGLLLRLLVLAGAGLLLMPLDRVFIAMTLFALVTLTLQMTAADLSAAFARSAAMFLGIFYIFGGWKTAILLHQRAPWWLFFALSITWVGDTGAYYIGRIWGRHKLAPRISPGKSWEGTAASVVSSVVYAVVLLPRVLPVSIPMAAMLGLLGNAAGQIGDLAESALKRSAGVKDSGTLLPGHGGMLDRVDSSLFSIPVIYAAVNWLGL
jgi:phosphatidate cytidylyltransferase